MRPRHKNEKLNISILIRGIQTSNDTNSIRKNELFFNIFQIIPHNSLTALSKKNILSSERI